MGLVKSGREFFVFCRPVVRLGFEVGCAHEGLSSRVGFAGSRRTQPAIRAFAFGAKRKVTDSGRGKKMRSHLAAGRF